MPSKSLSSAGGLPLISEQSAAKRNPQIGSESHATHERISHFDKKPHKQEQNTKQDQN